jgi:ABC-type lipoprotein export system ATPase subunit
MTPRLALKNVVRRYREKRTGRTVEALRVPGLSVEAGEMLAVVGPNGSGKSTLLETMAFLHRPDMGRILLDGGDVWADGRALAARRRCPLLLQRTVLLKTSVLRNVMLPLLLRGWSRPDARRRALAVLERVGLQSLANRGHQELSGGEKRRVALARLLVIESDVLLLDEPTAHVDTANQRLIEEVVRDLHTRSGATVILATHSSRQATEMADTVLTLFDGCPTDVPADNLLVGRLVSQPPGVVFHTDSGVTVNVARGCFGSSGDVGLLEQQQNVRIAVDPVGVEVLPGPAPADAWGGKIEVVQQKGDRCRLTVRVASNQQLTADMSLPDYLRLGLNLGSSVHLKVADGAIRLLDQPSRTEAGAQS